MVDHAWKFTDIHIGIHTCNGKIMTYLTYFAECLVTPCVELISLPISCHFSLSFASSAASFHDFTSDVVSRFSIARLQVASFPQEPSQD